MATMTFCHKRYQPFNFHGLLAKVRALCGPGNPDRNLLHGACVKASGFTGEDLEIFTAHVEAHVVHYIAL